MNEEFITLLEEFEKEKGISRDILIDALETALVSAYKRNYGANQDVRVEINRTGGGMSVFLKKYVVEEVEDEKLINKLYLICATEESLLEFPELADKLLEYDKEDSN